MSDLLKIILPMAATIALVWVYLKLMASLDEWWENKFGWSLLRRRTPKAEIQTLFHGNTKDEDQL